MATIKLSTMFGDRASLRLEQFKADTRHQVEQKTFAWSSAWDELLAVSLHNSGPDVSHIGNTWLGSLASMQSLQPFSDSDVSHIGGSKIFMPNAWGTTYLPEYPKQRYAIPWTLDTRVLIYRRDWSALAGVDEATAFTSHAALEETLKRLQAAGFKYPWSVSTVRNTAHSSAPWVWENGGDFYLPEQHQLLFTEPATMQGLYQFFGLYRYSPPVDHGLTIEEVTAQFCNEDVGVIYTTHHFIAQLLFLNPPPFGIQNVGVAKVPGTPYVGGNSLVIWKHTIHNHAAVELVRHLLSPETQRSLSAQGDQLPARAELLEQAPFQGQPLFQPVLESLRLGRAFHSANHWATIEKRLNITLNQLWVDMLNDPELDLLTELNERVSTFSKRIQSTFLSEK